jgi:hypothetical protein
MRKYAFHKRCGCRTTPGPGAHTNLTTRDPRWLASNVFLYIFNICGVLQGYNVICKDSFIYREPASENTWTPRTIVRRTLDSPAVALETRGQCFYRMSTCEASHPMLQKMPLRGSIVLLYAMCSQCLVCTGRISREDCYRAKLSARGETQRDDNEDNTLSLPSTFIMGYPSTTMNQSERPVDINCHRSQQ